MEETWKLIPLKDCKHKYFASTLGRFARERADGKLKIIQGHVTEYGYVKVGISFIHQRKCFFAHRLVLLTFAKSWNEHYQVNHINGIKTDNRLCNLELCTAKHNMAHASRTGLIARGERCSHAKLTAQQVRDIRQLLFNKTPVREIMRQYHICSTMVYNIKNKTAWKHID
ncbi:MAG: HNH endonuclease [Acetobacter sp.]|nr:HNH endonuclease [Acetobacter sp.]